MINVIQNGECYDITFNYDPNIIELVKSVPYRRWDPAGKKWIIPLNSFGFLLKRFQGTFYESQLNIVSNENLGQNAEMGTTTKIPDIDISNVTFYVAEGFSPFKHQLDFMKYAISRQRRGVMNGFLLADQMGLGKTLETCNLELYNRSQYGYKHCLIICCVNSSKYSWVEDIEMHTNGAEIPYILGDRKKKHGGVRSGSSAEKFYDLETQTCYGEKDPLPYFIIMNIEAIRYAVTDPTATKLRGKKKNRRYPVAEILTQLISDGTINAVLIDEVHKNVSMSSMQGELLLSVKQKTENKAQWIPMTGTPITKKPTDLFLPLRLIDTHNYNSYYMWCQKFCVYGGFGDHEIIGYKNIPYLKTLLQDNMLRRLKADVLKNLPPKIHTTEYVDNTEYQTRLYNKIRDGLRREAEREKWMKSLNPLSAFLRLRQVNGYPEAVDDTLNVDSKIYLSQNAKLQWLLDKLDEIHENGEKTIVFSNWVTPLSTLYKYVSKRYSVCCFHGEMTMEERLASKKKFIEDPRCTVLLGTVGAMGVNQTFTVAQNVIFYDEPWNPADKEQAEDRAHRIGTSSTVNIYTVLTRGTVDEIVHKILYKKEGISNFIVDDRKLDLYNNPDLFDLLLGGDE